MPRFDQPRRTPLAGPEKRMLVAQCALLIFLPWAWGTMHVWSQLVCLALAVACFVLALQPREEAELRSAFPAPPGSAVATPSPWNRLLRFPLFWLGLGFFAYITLQGLNASWVYERNTNSWWMRRVDSISWLPSGVEAPFGRYNGWRVLIVYVSAWLLVCSLWVGVTRRRTLQVLLSVLVVQAVVICLVGIAHRMSGSGEVLWLRRFSGAIGFGPFVYHNHGAAFVALTGVAALALATWQHFQAIHRFARSAPTLLWVMAWVAAVLGVAVSGSRAGLVIMGGVSLVAAVAFWWLRRGINAGAGSSRAVGISVALLLISWAGFMFWQTDLSEIAAKFRGWRERGQQEQSLQGRLLAREQGYAMLEDRWVTGWGAGSFRYMFVPYARRNPSVDDSGQALWEFLHNDWLQMPIEYGLVGCSFIVAALAWCAFRWLKGRGWGHPVAVMLALACSQTLVHAWIDFPLQNPAILLTWWALVIIGLRWLELDTAPKEPATALR